MANNKIIEFKNTFYGDYKCSGSGEPLYGLCYCVGLEDDDEGLYWRSFTPEFWNNNIKDKMTINEVYENFEPSKYAY